MPDGPTTPSNPTPAPSSSGGGTSTTRQDPLPAFCFKVELEINGRKGEAFFRSVGGLKYEAEIVDLREGGDNQSSRKLMGGGKWSNIILKRGFTGSSELLAWRNEWMSPSLEPGKARAPLTGTIIQLNADLTAKCSWKFTRGLPVKWELSDFDAGKNEVAIETLEIAHEGLTFTKG